MPREIGSKELRLHLRGKIKRTGQSPLVVNRERARKTRLNRMFWHCNQKVFILRITSDFVIWQAVMRTDWRWQKRRWKSCVKNWLKLSLESSSLQVKWRYDWLAGAIWGAVVGVGMCPGNLAFMYLFLHFRRHHSSMYQRGRILLRLKWDPLHNIGKIGIFWLRKPI